MPDALPAGQLRVHSIPGPAQWKLLASCLLSFRNGDCKVEGGTFAEFTVEPDAPSLHLHQAFGDVQAQACSRRFACLAILRAEESLEDPGLILEADTDAVILHPEMCHAFCAFRIPLVVG